VKRPVRWSRDALDDVKSQIADITAQNPVAATRVADRIHATATTLGDMTTGRPGRVDGTYEKLVARLPTMIVYAITEQDGREAVSILRVIRSDFLNIIVMAGLDPRLSGLVFQLHWSAI
jgi:toxin ParE1/3/4